MQLNEKQKFKREINEVKKIFAYQYIHEDRPKGILKEYKRIQKLMNKKMIPKSSTSY